MGKQIINMIAKCPSCLERIEYENQLAGSESVCPICQSVVVLPLPLIKTALKLSLETLKNRWVRLSSALFAIIFSILFYCRQAKLSGENKDKSSEAVMGFVIMAMVAIVIFQIINRNLWMKALNIALFLLGLSFVIYGLLIGLAPFSNQSSLISIIGGILIMLTSMILYRVSK